MEIDRGHNGTAQHNSEYPHTAKDTCYTLKLSTNLLREPPTPEIAQQKAATLLALPSIAPFSPGTPQARHERDCLARGKQIKLLQIELDQIKYIQARLQGVEFRIEDLTESPETAHALKHLLLTQQDLIDAHEVLQTTIQRLTSENAVQQAGQ